MRHNYDVQRALTRPWGMQVCECGALCADWAQMRDDHLLPLRESTAYVAAQRAARARVRAPYKTGPMTHSERVERHRWLRREQYRRQQRKRGVIVIPQIKYRVALVSV